MRLTAPKSLATGNDVVQPPARLHRVFFGILSRLALAMLISATCGCSDGSLPRESVPVKMRAAPRIALNSSATPPRFEVHGLSADELQKAALAAQQADTGQEPLAVYVGDTPGPDQPPMLGECRLDGALLVFIPRFPLEPGLNYTAVLRRGSSPASAVGEPHLAQQFAIPKRPPSPPARVSQVFPTTDRLPANQLKFYLHFSRPMRQGDVYQRVHLLDAQERRIEYPFLELGEELWDPSGTRLTLFFDPGRVKRGLKSREEAGPVLEPGKTYTLVIDREWPDVFGQPLKESFRKTFRVVDLDATQPDPSRWNLTLPPAGDRQPLVVAFDEPLDHAMLQRVLVVQDAEGKAIAGEIEVDRGEQCWRFRPQQAWSAGQYQLVVETTLEDLAGNSIGRLFEVDVFDTVEQKITTDVVRLEFEVRENRE